MKEIIEKAWENRELLKEKNTQDCIRNIIEELDKGRIRGNIACRTNGISRQNET